MTYDTVADELYLRYMKLFLKDKNLLNMAILCSSVQNKRHTKRGWKLPLKNQAGASSCPQDKGVQVHWFFIVAISFFCCNTEDEILSLWMLCKLHPEFLV